MAQSNQDGREVADIHQRLDSITRQIDQLSSPTERGEPAVARHLNDAISRLDARLARITAPAPARPVQEEDPQHRTDRAERAAAEVYSPSPSLDPASLEFAIAEIAARQHELGGSPRVMPPRSSPPVAPAMTTPQPSAPDFSGLERHLFKITSQIESLQRPDGMEQSIAAFRSELAGIRHVITEALPRRAIESIENEIRSLSRRIDDIRQSGSDGQALANIERALNEIYDALRALKPAEQLAGFDEAIRNLGGKIDTIVRSSGDSGMVQQLENAIGALRSIVSNVASNDALARLNDDLIMLSSKVDQLGRPDSHGDSFAALEQRVAALTATLENRERPAIDGNSEQLENAVRALSDRLDRLPAGHDSSSALAHLEQRVSLLLERLETAGGYSGITNLGRVEEGLQDILRQLERQQAGLAALAEGGPRSTGPGMDSDVVDAIKRELSEMRFFQSETDRHTQDSLEVVNNTLGHVVDRLAMIEGDLRAARSMPAAQAEPSRGAMPESRGVLPPKPELPNPVLSQMSVPQPAAAVPASASIPPRAISEILIPRDTFDPGHDSQSATPLAPQPRAAIDRICRPTIRWSPAPVRRDARVAVRAHRGTPKARSARSPEHRANNRVHRVSLPRRAAPRRQRLQRRRHPTSLAEPEIAIEPARPATGASSITSKIRSLLVGASVVVIVLGSFKFAMTLLDGAPRAAVSESSAGARPRRSRQPTRHRSRTRARDSAIAVDDLADTDRPAIDEFAPSGQQRAAPPRSDRTPRLRASRRPHPPTSPARSRPAHASTLLGSTSGAGAIPPSETLPESIGGRGAAYRRAPRRRRGRV